MEPDKITEQWIVMVKSLIIFFRFLKRLLKVILPAHAAHLHTAHSHVHTGPRGCFGSQIHIEDRRHAAGQIFQNRQLRQMIDHLPVHPCLDRKNLLREPLVERQIVRIRAKQGHTGMGMGILKARHQKIALAVDLPIPYDTPKI